jgi:peptidoglycan/LPS O-acetylase OafA/YrhL
MTRPPRLRKKPRFGARASITVHAVVVALCAIAILGGDASWLPWSLLLLNALAIAVITLSLAIGELPEDRKPFGPFTEAAEFFGFLDEDTPHGRAVCWLRKHGFLE